MAALIPAIILPVLGITSKLLAAAVPVAAATILPVLGKVPAAAATILPVLGKISAPLAAVTHVAMAAADTFTQALETRKKVEEEKRARFAVENATRVAEEARLRIERRWFEGVRPECRPSEEDVVQMKAKYHYSPGFFHLAVVGSSGGGKSSFINAVRGLSNDDPIAAPTGIVETTNKVTRYSDPRPDSQIIWYDVPGAGTQNVPDWQYFNDLGLYIFDCIIVLIDIRFFDSDLAILRACEQFTNIQAFVVRSKSDQHISNMTYAKMPSGFDPLEEIDDNTRRRLVQIRSEERMRFIEETRRNVQMNLERQNLSPQGVYIVCRNAMQAIWNNSNSSSAIDEAELQNAVKEFERRRLESES
ncbi:P-loop containing nucleoside triphosphate hydrolase protein [Suillus lakei]|nr:P-loop containing nucleoside triphosphate hydrolase protein [Suillus lakei]